MGEKLKYWITVPLNSWCSGALLSFAWKEVCEEKAIIFSILIHLNWYLKGRRANVTPLWQNVRHPSNTHHRRLYPARFITRHCHWEDCDWCERCLQCCHINNNQATGNSHGNIFNHSGECNNTELTTSRESLCVIQQPRGRDDRRSWHYKMD